LPEVPVLYRLLHPALMDFTPEREREREERERGERETQRERGKVGHGSFCWVRITQADASL